MSATVKRLYLHPPLERFWHAIHTLCILLLILTGINLRFPQVHIFGLRIAVNLHNVLGQILTVDFIFWVPYLVITGRYKYYVPRRSRDLVGGLIRQARFYGLDVFRGGSHPFEVTEEHKFNPLQKWAYVGVMFGMVPLLVITGIGLMMPERLDGMTGGYAHLVALVHRLMAYFSAAFVASHIYMATMGYTPFDAFKSMVTGWALEASHEGHGEEPGKAKAEQEADVSSAGAGDRERV